MDSIPCMICNRGGHEVSKCPTLVESLRDGFYRGQAEPGGHDHDDDEQLVTATKDIYPL